MSHEKDIGTAQALPASGTHCGLRPSKEAMEEGFSVDFSAAKKLLEESLSDNSSEPDLNSKPAQPHPTDIE